MTDNPTDKKNHGAGRPTRRQIVTSAAMLVREARALRRSVRVVLTRQQMCALGYRQAMIKRIALGANTGATLDAITHHAITGPAFCTKNRHRSKERARTADS